ncbi:MAG TPA: substrate-binding domain-containing protein [Thermoleophilaceae bacterium]|nr:substrate-binding domain-containing protein [Thermoleophilaceae bacterium]
MGKHSKARAGGGAVAALAAIAALAPAAQADFSGVNALRCTGDSINGRGASFQRDAQAAWAKDFRENVTGGGCPTWQFTGQNVTYEALGSGAGRTAFGRTNGVYDPAVRYAASDEPPSPTEQATMEAGANGFHGDLHTIPAAAGSVAVVVNVPDGCAIPAASRVGSGSTARFQVPRATLENAWAGDSAVDTWGELLPGIGGAGCDAKAVKRVVRLDSSGTTFAFKAYLHDVNTGRGWKALGNTAWPNDATNPVLRGSANGNGPLVAKVTETDGSIGYSDVSTARGAGFDERGSTDDDRYWIPVQNLSGDYEEPTADPSSHTNGNRGSNCGNTTFVGVPNNTQENWFNAEASSQFGYPVCTLTYALAWDDYATAYGNTVAEQAKARSVKDYLTYVVSDQGQNVAQATDYSRLPSSILSKARAGVNAVGWNK